jgi:MFS family permease
MEEFKKNDQQNGSTKLDNQNPFLKWTVGILALSFGTQYFSEIEGNWINSFLKYYTDMGSNTAVSILVALRNIVGTIAFILFGVLSDVRRSRWGRRLPFIVLGAFGTAFILFFIPLIQSTILFLFIAGILISATSNGMHMSGRVIVPDMIPQEKRGRINTLMTLMANLASIIMWILSLSVLPSGVEKYSFEVHSLFILSGALVLLFIGTISLFLLRQDSARLEPKDWRDELKKIFNITEFRRNKNMLVVFLGSLFVLMAQAAYFPFLLILVQEIEFTFETIVLALPIILSVMGVCLFLVLHYIDKIGRRNIVLIGTMLAPMGSVLMVLSDSSFFFISGLAIMMPMVIVTNIGVDTWIQDLLPEEARGRFMGVIRLAHGVGQVPGVVLAGILADRFGIMYIFLAAGIILWLSVPIFLKAKESLKVNV